MTILLASEPDPTNCKPEVSSESNGLGVGARPLMASMVDKVNGGSPGGALPSSLRPDETLGLQSPQCSPQGTLAEILGLTPSPRRRDEDEHSRTCGDENSRSQVNGAASRSQLLSTKLLSANGPTTTPERGTNTCEDSEEEPSRPRPRPVVKRARKKKNWRIPSKEKIQAMIAGRRRARELREQAQESGQCTINVRDESMRASSSTEAPRTRREAARTSELAHSNSVGIRVNGMPDRRFKRNLGSSVAPTEPATKKPKLTPGMRSKLIIEGKRRARERRQKELMAAQCGYPSEAPQRTSLRTSGVPRPPTMCMELRSSRRARTPTNMSAYEPVPDWFASGTSSSSRAAPFPFVRPPVLHPEMMPRGVNILKEIDIKLIGRRKPALHPLPDLLYDITKVFPAAKDSILFRTKCRETWIALVPEMSMLSSEAGWRNRHLLPKKDQHTYDSKPLRMDYIYDRITCDDPVDGWQIRCRHTGQLQGFLTYTNFVTYQPLVFHGSSEVIKGLNRCHRQNSYWFGCVWPEVVELVLLGALSCGTLLMEEFLDSLVDTNVKFVIIHATVHAREYYEKLGFQRIKAYARYDVKNRQLRTPTVTSAGYDGGYGYHMLLLQFTNDMLATVPANRGLHEIAAQADRGTIPSIYRAWKAFEPHITFGSKMASKQLYEFYRTQYRVHEEIEVDVTSSKYISAFMKDSACYPYHHWQFKSVTSSELEDPSLLLVLELSSWPGRKNASTACTQPISEWKCPPLYRWVRPLPGKLTPRTLTYIPDGAPGAMSCFQFWYIAELIPDLRWAHVIPMIQKGNFPLETARKGRPRFCLQPRGERERELSISMDRLVPVAADCIRGRNNDPDLDIWDVKNFNPQDCFSPI